MAPWTYLAVVCLLAVSAWGQEETECVCLEEVVAARDFRNPLIIISAEDGTDRLFIGEQTGTLWVFEREDEFSEWQRLPEPFLELDVYFDSGSYDESGYLATRFHPDYADNGLLYVYYSIFSDSTGGRGSRLSELRVDPEDPNKADPDYERILMEISQNAYNHNGGDILFMPDGTLILSTGDGGLQGDPFDVAQDLSSDLGKILRIDVDNTEGDLPYAIPSDNPFLGVEGALPEIYAYGFRNPWRMYQDRGDSEGNGAGRVFIGDVGQNAYEEVDVLESGGNFGWSVWEAYTCYKPQYCGTVGPTIFPIEYYSHDEGIGQCIIQGSMYRGCEYPGMYGWLIYSDYMTGTLVRLLDQGDSAEWTGRRLFTTCDDCADYGLDTEYLIYILTMGEDERGEMYFGSAPEQFGPPDEPTGRVYKIRDPANTAAPCPLNRRKK